MTKQNESDTDSTDRPTLDITPAMIEAGKDAFLTWEEEADPWPENLAKLVFQAMIAVRNRR